MNTAQLLVGPLGPFDPHEDTHILARSDGRWLVSERSTRAPLRLSDANPTGKVQAWAAPGSAFAQQLGVEVGRAELFSDGLLVAAVAPGEWLALTPEEGGRLVATLGGLAGGEPVILVERSAGLALFRLTGQTAGDALAACCEDLDPNQPMEDGAVLSAPLGGIRCTLIRDDLLPEELIDELDVATDEDSPLVTSYLVVCDRSLAGPLHARLLEAGRAHDIAAEGFSRYRAYHADV